MSPTSFQCQLHCSHTIRHCFGLLEKCNAHSDFNIKQQDAQLSNLDYGFFECLPVATSTSSTTSVTTIVLKIYHSRSIYGGGSSKSWLILNEEFAKLNELKHGNMLLLLPVQKYNRCKQVELYPFTNDDFKAIAYSASAIEELFLSQINVVRSDMLFPIFMFQDSSIKFKIKVPDSSMEQNYLLDKDTRISICSPLNTTDNKTDVQKSVELSTENIKTDMDIKIEETDCEFRVEQDIRNFIWPRASSCFYRVLPSNILANFKQFPASEEDANPFLAPEYEFSSLANSLPFLFILRRSETFKEQAYFVEIIEGSQNQLEDLS